MQNERSASDARCSRPGSRRSAFGKIVGVPTMGAVIGTGAYTARRSTITPGSVWMVTSQNMENLVPPDVLVDNTPRFREGPRRADEKAVDVLKADLAAKKPSTAQP